MRRRTPQGLWLRLLLALAAMALFAFGYQWGNQVQYAGSGSAPISGVLIQPPGAIPDFALKDAFGQRFERARLVDHWSLIALGDLAQANGQRAAQRLIDAFNRVADHRALGAELQLVLVSEPDRPALARDFGRLSPALHILSGSDDQVARLRAALGGKGDDQPTLFLIGPEATLIALFPADDPGASVAEDLKTLHARGPIPNKESS